MNINRPKGVKRVTKKVDLPSKKPRVARSEVSGGIASKVVFASARDGRVPFSGDGGFSSLGHQVQRAEEVAHQEGTQLFRPEWTLLEDESITANNQSADKFFQGVIPPIDRYYCRQLDGENMLTLLSASHSTTLALTWDLRRRFQEAKSALSRSEDKQAIAETSSDRANTRVAELLEEAGEKDGIIKAQKQEIDRLREENAELNKKLEEAEVFLGTQLVENYKMACEDFLAAIKKEHPGLDLRSLIPDPTAFSEDPPIDKSDS